MESHSSDAEATCFKFKLQFAIKKFLISFERKTHFHKSFYCYDKVSLSFSWDAFKTIWTFCSQPLSIDLTIHKNTLSSTHV